MGPMPTIAAPPSPSASAWLHHAIARIEADYQRSADTHLIPLPLPAFAADGVDLYAPRLAVDWDTLRGATRAGRPHAAHAADGTARQQLPRNRLANALTRAGDDADLVVQTFHEVHFQVQEEGAHMPDTVRRSGRRDNACSGGILLRRNPGQMALAAVIQAGHQCGGLRLRQRHVQGDHAGVAFCGTDLCLRAGQGHIGAGYQLPLRTGTCHSGCHYGRKRHGRQKRDSF